VSFWCDTRGDVRRVGRRMGEEDGEAVLLAWRDKKKDKSALDSLVFKSIEFMKID
jgi:hypothetical protein